MRFLTVSSCLGFDLRTGGLLAGYVEMYPFVILLFKLTVHPVSWEFALDCTFFYIVFNMQKVQLAVFILN